MRRPATIPCPHCGAALPRLSAWHSVPAKWHPNYFCTECRKPAWFPLNTRIFAMLASLLTLLVTIWMVFPLLDLDTPHPAAMMLLFIVLLGAGLLASVWISGAVCARSTYLERSNF